jgi:hypothetical protein
MVVALNAVQEAGTGNLSTSNYYTYQFNWGSSFIFLANMSGTTSSPAQITLRRLYTRRTGYDLSPTESFCLKCWRHVSGRASTARARRIVSKSPLSRA